MGKNAITMIYVYEAFVLILSSTLFGLFIGLFVGYLAAA